MDEEDYKQYDMTPFPAPFMGGQVEKSEATCLQ
jgi:hypothetical protein